MHTYTHTCIYVPTRVHIHICGHMYAHVYMNMPSDTHVHTCMLTYKLTWLHAHSQVSTQTCLWCMCGPVCVHVCAHVRIHLHIQTQYTSPHTHMPTYAHGQTDIHIQSTSTHIYIHTHTRANTDTHSFGVGGPSALCEKPWSVQSKHCRRQHSFPDPCSLHRNKLLTKFGFSFMICMQLPPAGCWKDPCP